MNGTLLDDGSATIFVVEDDESVRDSVATSLRRIGAKIETFRSAEDFLQGWKGPRPGCLVLDVRMTGMSGLELQQTLNKQHDYLSIVIVTGHATVQLSVDVIKRGAIDLLQKPYAPDQLRQVVSDGLKRSAALWKQMQLRIAYEAKRDSLSPREREVYGLLLQGHENKQIAVKLSISPSTVEKHRLAVVKKMGTENVTQLFGQKFHATGTIHDTTI